MTAPSMTQNEKPASTKPPRSHQDVAEISAFSAVIGLSAIAALVVLLWY